MSEHPDQQQPPPFVLPPRAASHPLSASKLGQFRRGAVFMFVLGGLMLLGSVLCLVMPLLPDEFWEQQIQQLRTQGQDPFPPNTPIPDIRRELIRQFLTLGVMGVLVAVAEIILGLFVYRGRRGPAIAAAALGVLMLGVMGLMLIYTLVMAVMAGPSALGAFFILLLPAALVAVQCMRLMEALRPVAAAQPRPTEAPAKLGGLPAQPPPLPPSAHLPPGEPPILDYNFAAAQRLPPPPAAPAR